jgi:4-hydroxy-tetrahydrodipicolinate synthase
MRRSRECAGEDLQILSGDDDMTFTMMTDPCIGAGGVISVISNVAPGPVQQMTEAVLEGDAEEGQRLYEALKPLFGIVTVKTQEESPWGSRLCKARNPLPIKTLMRLLGMPVGPPRRPLGKMTRAGLAVVRDAARRVWKNSPQILRPVEEAFSVDVEERLEDPDLLDGLYYEE